MEASAMNEGMTSMTQHRRSGSVRRTLLVGFAMCFGWALFTPADTVHALPCTDSDSVCSLNFWNVSELNGSGDVINATLGGLSGGLYTTLSFQWVSGNPVPPSAIGIDMIGWTGTIGVAASGCAAGWDCNLGSQNMAGFGVFRQFEKDPGGTGGIAPDVVTFALAQGVSGFSAFPLNNTNRNRAQFAAHVRYSDSCSGFVSNGTTTSVGSDDNCATKVPEPSALLLLGAGLLALAVGRGSASTLKHPTR
jgi:hypothetical protein